MKPIQSIVLKRDNSREKLIAILFVISFVFLMAGLAKGQGTYNEANIHVTKTTNKIAPARKSIASYHRYRSFIIERTRNQVHYNFVSNSKKTTSLNAIV